MSMEWQDFLDKYHQDLANEFQKGGKGRYVTYHAEDVIYVYLHQDGVHVQTQHVDIPESWWERWPSEETVVRRIRKYARIGSARIRRRRAEEE